MTTKEKIINSSIQKVEKRLEEIEFLLNSSPLVEICRIRTEAQILLKETDFSQYTNPEFLVKIHNLSEREKEQFKIYEKSKDTIKLIKEKVKLTFELGDLKQEIYSIKNI